MDLAAGSPEMDVTSVKVTGNSLPGEVIIAKMKKQSPVALSCLF